MTENLGGAEVDERLLHLSGALLVESEVRKQRDRQGLSHYLVNESSRIQGHKLAFLLRPSRYSFKKTYNWKLVAASDMATLDDASPLGDWLRTITRSRQDDGVVFLTVLAELPPSDAASGFPSHVMFMPLAHPDGGLAGILILFRDTPWRTRDRLLAEPLAECYGHALVRLDERPYLSRSLAGHRRFVAGGLLVAIVGVGFWPVPLTALAPVEVVPTDPIPITAPFDGIVSDFVVQPYTSVAPGQVVAEMDGTELTMQRDVALKALDVALAELTQSRNQAFSMADSKSKIAIGEKVVDLRQQELANAESKLARHRIPAPATGLVIYDARFDWKGRPVKAGQLLMTLADPRVLDVQIDLPVANLIPLAEGATVTLFLNIDPSTPIPARLTRVGFIAQPVAGGMLAYRYRATITGNAANVFLGARGTGRLEGERVTLAYALLRRPFAAVRQFLGF